MVHMHMVLLKLISKINYQKPNYSDLKVCICGAVFLYFNLFKVNMLKLAYNL